MLLQKFRQLTVQKYKKGKILSALDVKANNLLRSLIKDGRKRGSLQIYFHKNELHVNDTQ